MMNYSKKLKTVIGIICCLALFAGCSSKLSTKNPASSSAPTPTPTKTSQGVEFTPGYQFIPPQKGDTVAIMKTSMGDIKIKLFPGKAPKAVENFVKHAKDGYYNNLIFHRVINDFMIQGGDPLGNGTGGESIWGTPFEDEFTPDLMNYRGALSMANSGPNTNGSQFFIVQAKTVNSDMLTQMTSAGYPEQILNLYKEHGGTPHLDFVHTVFGQVYEGLDIVDKIAAVKTDENDKPVQDVIIKSVEIQEIK